MECCGTSLFLKKMMGVGYTLCITKSSERTEAQEGLLHNMISSTFPGYSLISSAGLELLYRIPMEETSALPSFLDQIERNPVQFGILAFSLSLTTLEEVFLNVGRHADVSSCSIESGVLPKENANPVPQNLDREYDLASVKRKRGVTLWLKHFGALFLKRAISDWRNPTLLWRLVDAPICWGCFMLVVWGCSSLFGPEAVSPVEALKTYPYTKTVPHLLQFAFTKEVGDEYRNQQIKIMDHCDKTIWEPKYLRDIRSRSDMDKHLLKNRQNIKEERAADFHRPYVAILFDANTATKIPKPYPILIHDSGFGYSLSVAMAGYSECVARYGASVAQSQVSGLRVRLTAKIFESGVKSQTKKFINAFSASVLALVLISMCPVSQTPIVLSTVNRLPSCLVYLLLGFFICLYQARVC